MNVRAKGEVGVPAMRLAVEPRRVLSSSHFRREALGISSLTPDPYQVEQPVLGRGQASNFLTHRFCMRLHPTSSPGEQTLVVEGYVGIWTVFKHLWGAPWLDLSGRSISWRLALVVFCLAFSEGSEEA